MITEDLIHRRILTLTVGMVLLQIADACVDLYQTPYLVQLFRMFVGVWLSARIIRLWLAAFAAEPKIDRPILLIAGALATTWIFLSTVGAYL